MLRMVLQKVLQYTGVRRKYSWAESHHGLDPFVGLALGVNEEGPPLRVLYDNAILSGEDVSGQTADVPLSDQHWVSQCLYKANL